GLMQVALEMRGYRVLTAADAEAALVLSSQHPDRLDLLITDLSLPGVSGSALAREVGQSRPGVPVLYISGCLEETPPGAGGKVAYLPKPFTPRQLLEVV